MSRILVWYSDGAASAVAAKVAVTRWPDRQVEIIKCDTTPDEHPDNLRFRADVERWIGREVKLLTHPKYRTVTEVWEGERYVSGVLGATCTRHLKREVREAYQRSDDEHVIGYTADEKHRIAWFEGREPDIKSHWLLAAAGITKADCYRIVQSAGIALPWMYLNDYEHNNCLGCAKGGMGYFNKIRTDFPEVFEKRRKTWAALGVKPFVRRGVRISLDQLNPGDGRDEPPQDIECGVFCAGYGALINAAARLPICPAPLAGTEVQS